MTRPFSSAAAGLVLLMLAPTTALAGRPLVTEDTFTLDPGASEVELSATHARGAGERLWLAGFALNHGLVPGLEVKVESAMVVRDPPGQPALAGIGDSIVGAKYRFLDESPVRPAVMGVVTARLPTGDADRGLGRPAVDVTALGALSKTLGPVNMTANGGPSFVTADRRLDVWIASGSVEYRVARILTLVGEVVSDFSTRGRDPHVLVRAGAVFLATGRAVIDGAIAAGLTRDTPDVVVTIGITFGFYPARP